MKQFNFNLFPLSPWPRWCLLWNGN